MGGVIFIVSVIVTSLFYMKDYPAIIPVAFSTPGFGIIGFMDDYIKVVKKRNLGLTPLQKMAGQFVITGISQMRVPEFSFRLPVVLKMDYTSICHGGCSLSLCLLYFLVQ